ncbi:MAG: hypothetical protein ACI89L_000546 [Phycisphaerales bacterium]|jgi:hypothetical protein
MSTLVAIYLFGLSALILLVMVWQHATGKREFLSLRNAFLIGFVIFQLSSVGLRMFSREFNGFRMSDPVSAATEFSMLASVFIAVFFLFYEGGWGVKKLASKVPHVPEAHNPAALITLAVLMTLLAVPLRFAFNLPAIGVLANFLGVGAAAMACGLVGWVWAPRLLNPAMAIFATLFLAVNLVTVMTGSFGRRSILAVFGCMVWGMYYSHWRYLPARSLLVRFALISAGPVIFLALYTSVRSAAEHDRSAGEHMSAIQTGGSVTSGLVKLLDGQGTGPAGLWLIEHYPEDYRPRYFFTATYFVGISVPRVIWPGKPEPLSVLIADQANIRGVQQDRIKLSCGIIGVAAAEGGIFAAIFYGACGGLFLRFFEQIARNNVRCVFIVLPIGAAMGQVLGLARGDTSAFANTYFITTMGSLALMIPIGRFMTRFETETPAVFDDYEDGTDEHAEPDESDYLEDPDQAA